MNKICLLTDIKTYSMYTTSSVETFPEAPTAYGQPPSPATEESIVLIPSPRAA